jgi:hypothetical protein
MGAARKKADEVWTQSRPATSREARQAQLENLAMDLAEKQLRSGEASSQVITQFLRSASTRGRVEELRLKAEVDLMKARKAHIESQEEMHKLFKEAVQAMGAYHFEGDETDDQDVHGGGGI